MQENPGSDSGGNTDEEKSKKKGADFFSGDLKKHYALTNQYLSNDGGVPWMRLPIGVWLGATETLWNLGNFATRKAYEKVIGPSIGGIYGATKKAVGGIVGFKKDLSKSALRAGW